MLLICLSQSSQPSGLGAGGSGEGHTGSFPVRSAYPKRPVRLQVGQAAAHASNRRSSVQRGVLWVQGASGWGQPLLPSSWEARLEGNRLQSGGIREFLVGAGVSSSLGPHRTLELQGPCRGWTFPGRALVPRSPQTWALGFSSRKHSREGSSTCPGQVPQPACVASSEAMGSPHLALRRPAGP